MSQIYLKKNTQFKALILMGSALLRNNIEINDDGNTQINFTPKVLAIGGTKDGLFRVTRMAESFYNTIININLN